MLSLANKHILLGISGGIAAYKSAELCRLLVKAGARVRVCMTDAAQEFITPLTLQALSGERVLTSLLDEESEAAMGHIELARWADLVLVAPATANFMARLAAGKADDLLTTLCLATSAKLAIAPAMNQAMWNNPATQQNLPLLQERGVVLLGPDSGEQACGDIGPGRMLEPVEICTQASRLFQQGELAGINLTVTAGPTREAIDPVRYISNHSSGKMGYAIAQAAHDAGAEVTLITGPVHLEAPEVHQVVKVESAEEMLQAARQAPGQVFISVAAVCDYRPAEISSQKLKKKSDSMNLQLVKNPDIVSEIACLLPRPFCVGFAAETENLETNARQKLSAKDLDMIVANDATATFNSDEAELTVYTEDGSTQLEPQRKTAQARALVALIAARLKTSGKA